MLLNRILRKYLNHFFFFYEYLKYRILISLSLSLLVGVLDGFGLAMFLPLLQTIDNGLPGIEYEAQDMGNLSFILKGITGLGLPLTLTTVLLVMLVFFSAKGVFRFLEGYCKVVNQRYFIKNIRYANIDLLSSYKYKSFVLTDAGRIQNTLSGEVERVVTAYRSYFSAVQFGVLVIVYIVLATLANPKFATMVVVGAGLTNLFYKKIYNVTKRLSREVTKMNHDFQGLLLQEVAFFKYLKATGYIAIYGGKLKSSIVDIEKVAKKMGLLSSALQGLREPIVIAVVISLILIQVNVLNQQLGLIILSLLFFYRSLSYLMSVQNHWNTFLGVSGSLDNMTEFAEELKAGHDSQGTRKFSGLANEIVIRDVSFWYGDRLILDSVTFDIGKNETVALVGESGSGKSTLMNLLCGLMLPEGGSISFDGVSMVELDRISLQNRIGYITQDPVVFNDTIFNNVTLWAGKTAENLARFTRALERAAISDFVNSLPLKEESLLGYNGILVSGGQKQRLSIARELFKEVDFLFFDEATSALDSETEREIQYNMDSLRGDYTIIIIAHRLSTIKHADNVILLSKGRVEMYGTFDYLIEKSENFRRMVKFQEF